MTDENKTQVVDNGGHDDPDTAPKLSYEDLAKELANVRKEAASRRVLTREQEAQIKEYEAWKASQMSELEKAQKLAEDLKAQRKSDAIEIAQVRFGLEPDDIEFLRGDTKEEIIASAEKLAKRLGRSKKTDDDEDQEVIPTTSSNPNLFPGTRGNPVGSGRVDHNAELRRQLFGG